MTVLYDSFPTTLAKMFIGVDRLHDELAGLGPATNSNYPPFNVIRDDAEHYTIEMALAGFSPENISVTTKNGTLTVASASEKRDNEDSREYVYRGLAHREFTRSFKLHENVTVVGAAFHNGVLSIQLEHHVPDHLKQKTIEIKTDISKKLKN